MIGGYCTSEGAARYAARFPGAAQNQFFRLAQGRLVSTLGLGTYLGETTEAAGSAYQSAIQEAVSHGINLLDTAINYRNQHSEQDLGKALLILTESGAAARDEILLCTKAGFLTPGAVPRELLRPDDIVANMHSMAPDFLADQIDRSRRNLGVETLDVFYLHNPETQLSVLSSDRFEHRIRLAFEKLELLASEGKIQFYGAATWNGFRLKHGDPQGLSLPRLLEIAQAAGGAGHRFRFIQLPFNLAMTEAFARKDTPYEGETLSVLEIAARAGITVIASASLLQARLAPSLPESLRAIQFTRSTPGITAALVGMGRVEHVQQNLRVASFRPEA